MLEGQECTRAIRVELAGSYGLEVERGASPTVVLEGQGCTRAGSPKVSVVGQGCVMRLSADSQGLRLKFPLVDQMSLFSGVGDEGLPSMAWMSESCDNLASIAQFVGPSVKSRFRRGLF